MNHDTWTSMDPTRLTHTEDSRMWKRIASEYMEIKALAEEKKIYEPLWGDTVERPLPDLLYTMDEHDLGEIE